MKVIVIAAIITIFAGVINATLNKDSTDCEVLQGLIDALGNCGLSDPAGKCYFGSAGALVCPLGLRLIKPVCLGFSEVVFDQILLRPNIWPLFGQILFGHFLPYSAKTEYSVLGRILCIWPNM